MSVVDIRLGFAVLFAFVRQNPFLVPAFLQTCFSQAAVYFLWVGVALLVKDAKTLGTVVVM